MADCNSVSVFSSRRTNGIHCMLKDLEIGGEIQFAIADGALPSVKAYSSEEYLKVTEEQLKASAAKGQKQETPLKPQTQHQTQPPGSLSLFHGRQFFIFSASVVKYGK